MTCLSRRLTVIEVYCETGVARTVCLRNEKVRMESNDEKQRMNMGSLCHSYSPCLLAEETARPRNSSAAVGSGRQQSAEIAGGPMKMPQHAFRRPLRHTSPLLSLCVKFQESELWCKAVPRSNQSSSSCAPSSFSTFFTSASH